LTLHTDPARHGNKTKTTTFSYSQYQYQVMHAFRRNQTSEKITYITCYWP